jgi:hypothetical protein
MAGSGEFTRTGNTRALNANLMGAVSNTPAGPPGDLVGTLSSAATAGVVTTITCSAGTLKALPTGAQLIIVDAAGTLSTMEMVTLTSAYASGTTTAMNITSQTIKTTHAIGAFVYLGAFTPYLALLISSAPTDNTLGTEYSQTGYARQLIPWTAPTAADPPVAANYATCTFGPLSGANGSDVVGYAGLHDSLSGGAIANRYAWWTFGATRTPAAGDSLQIAAAALSMQSYH